MKRVNLFLLQLAVALFFIVLGTLGVLPDIGEGIYSLNDNRALELGVGIAELVCGAILLLGLFASIRKQTLRYAGVLVFIFWALRIAYSRFFVSFPFASGTIVIGTTLTWLLYLLSELIMLFAIYLIVRRHDEY